MIDARRALIAAALLALSGCAAEPARESAEAEGVCRTTQRSAAAALGSTATFDYVCKTSAGESSVGAFTLTTAPAAEGTAKIRAAVEASVNNSLMTRNQADRLNCRGPEWLPSAGPAEGWRVTPCSARLGGWPTVSVIAPTPFGLVQGDLPPNALAELPAIPAAIRQQAAPEVDAPSPPGWSQTATAWMTRSFGAAANFDPADIERYRRRMFAGPIHNSQGDHLEAERAYREALTIQLRLLPPDHPALIDALVALGVEVSNQSRHEEAEALFRRAEQIARAAGVDEAVQARLKSGRSLAAGNKDDVTNGLKLAREATEIHRRRSGRGANSASGSQVLTIVGDSSDFDLALALSAEASMALRAKQVEEAGKVIDEALKLLDDNPSLPAYWRPAFLMQASAVAQRRANFEAAEQYLLTALDMRRAMLGDSRPTASVHFALGRLYRSQKMLREALASFRAGVRIVENDPLGRAELTIDRFLPYLNVLADQAAADPARKARYEVEMFRASQLVQGSVAGEAVARTSATLAIEDPGISELARALVDLKRRRDAALLAISTEAAKPPDRRDRKKEVALVEEVKAVGLKIVETNQALRRGFPGFDRLNTPRAVSEADVLARLAPDEAVLSFTFGREGGFAFFLHRGKAQAISLDMTIDDVNQSVAELRRPFLAKGGAVPPYDAAAAHRLFEELAGPFAAQLANVKHLIVVPFGPLLALPPVLLVTEKPRPGPLDYSQVAWLGRDRSLSVAPSVRAFVEMRAARALPSAPKTFLGVGDPPFAGAASLGGKKFEESCRDNGVMEAALLRSLDPLPETSEEIRRAAKALGAGPEDILLGAEASEPRLRERALDDYRVLYFASHGLLPGELKCQAQPGLALAPPAVTPDRADQDGLLDASEVAGLKLRADLVVLSACNTAGSGVGRFGGEALSGLAEAFFNAGARSLLVSHWQVPSDSTMEMMGRMFERLGQRFEGGVAEALQIAQSAMIANPNSAHPVFWAAFTLVGDGGKPLREIDEQIAAAK